MVANGAFKLAPMDIVKWLAVGPWLFEIINFKVTVWWYPVLISIIHYLISGSEFYHAGWIGLRSMPAQA